MNISEIKEQFASLLQAHDWTYKRSNHAFTQLKGAKHFQKIMNFMSEHKEHLFILTKMYDEANPFNNNKTII